MCPLDIEEVFKPRVPKAAETFMEDEMMHDAETFEPEPTAAVKTSAEYEGERIEWELRGTRRGSSAIAGSSRPASVRPPAPIKPAASVDKAVSVVEQPAPAEWEHGLEPRTMNEACLLAKRLHESRMLMFDGLREPSSCPVNCPPRARARDSRDGLAP